MSKWMLSLLVLTTVLGAKNHYDDPSTAKYKELCNDFRHFVITIYKANLVRKKRVFFPNSQSSCENRCNEARSNTYYCHCDINCQLYRDCCFDYWRSCNKNKTVLQSEQDRRTCINVVNHQAEHFLYWFDSPTKMPGVKGHEMISTCHNSSSDLERNCLTPDPKDAFGPIPVEGKDNLTYRNRYCARCNGNQIENTTNWRMKLICRLKNNISNKTAEELRLNNCKSAHKSSCTIEDEKYFKDSCTWFYYPPKGHSKTHTICSPVETCPQTPVINTTASEYRELALKCQAYMRIVFSDGVYYKNFHCALCHGVDPIQLQSMVIPGVWPTLSIFFEISKAKVRRFVHHPMMTNGTNTTGPLQNDSYITVTKTQELPGERYLTSAGCVVSMVSLILLLILYLRFESLRTTPGKIIMGLSVSLLVYQTMLPVNQSLIRKSAACSIAAIFLHYAILLSFAWMNVMSYNVWMTFGTKKNRYNAKNKSTFLFYALYAVFSPLILVITAIVLDQAGVMSVYWPTEERYPRESCWIVNSMSRMVFFIVPVGLTLLLNITAFVWTVVGITLVQQETKKLQSSDLAHLKLIKNIKMFGKLSIVMGVTWILGFTIDSSKKMRYLYVSINSLQGFFIFLAFVTNKRVLQKCRKASVTKTRVAL